MIPALRRALPLGTIVLLAACGPNVLHVEDHSRSPRAPEQVQLMLDAPDRPYRTIALIRSRPEGLFQDMEKLKREVRDAAARLGADAVILSLDSHAGTETVTVVDTEGNVAVGSGSSGSLHVFGRAIIFQGESRESGG